MPEILFSFQKYFIFSFGTFNFEWFSPPSNLENLTDENKIFGPKISIVLDNEIGVNPAVVSGNRAKPTSFFNGTTKPFNQGKIPGLGMHSLTVCVLAID